MGWWWQSFKSPITERTVTLDGRWKSVMEKVCCLLVAGFLHKVPTELGELFLVSDEAELPVVNLEEGGELAVGAEAAVPQVLAQDVGQVGQVLDPHRPVVLNGHLVQDEVVPVLHRAHHGLLDLFLDVTLHFTVTFPQTLL